MNSIISQILAIEHKAQDMVADAEKQKESILASAKTDCDKIAQEIDARRQRRIELLTENEKQAAKRKMESVQKENEKKMKSLENRFASKKEAWVNEIYHNVIGR